MRGLRVLRDLTKILHQPSGGKVSSLILLTGSLISRVLGFIREMAMAAIFGTSSATDSWLMASILPNLLFNTLNASLTNVIVPILSGSKEKSPGDTEGFIQEFFTIIVLASLLLTLLGEWWTGPIVHLLAPGFNNQQRAITASMTRIMLPTVLFWAISGLATGILQSRNIYAPTSAAPVIMNIVRISTILLFGWLWGIVGVAVGFSLSVASQWLYLLPALRREGFTLRFRRTFSNPWTKRSLVLSLPFLYGNAVGTAGIIVDRVLASSLPTGNIAALNYSLLLTQLPIGLVITAYVLPYFTKLSAHWNQGQDKDFKTLVAQGIKMTTLLITPFTLAFLFAPTLILQITLQHGAFNRASTALTSHILQYWAIGLPGAAWTFFLTRVLFAQQNTRATIWLSTITIGFNIALDLILIHPMGAAGLALATGLAGWLRSLLIWLLLLKQKRGTNMPPPKAVSET